MHRDGDGDSSIKSTVVTETDEQGKESASSYGVDVTHEDNEAATFAVDITMEGGSGKAYIESPVSIEIVDGKMKAVLVWSSENYDYMLVDGVRYDNENVGGKSTFTIPVKSLDEPLTVTGDTVAMSTPHEIEYTIFWGDTAGEKESVKTEGNDTDGRTDLQHMFEGKLGSLDKTGEMELKYAKQYSVSYYGDYAVISILNSGNYLLVPEDKELPEGIPEDMIVLKQPVNKTYLVSTAAMDLICECGGIDNILFSGTKEDAWYVKDASDAMKDGKIIYAGKYRAPDYELILSGGCNLAVENTMIYHDPEVKEKLEELGIPVLVETSSYEESPLGRLEWIKLYGLLYGRESESEEYYNRQVALLEPVIHKENTGLNVAFFHITTNGMVTVRKPGDYISEMIEMAGGRYVPTSEYVEGWTSRLGKSDNSSALSTINMQMEDFYASAMEADILIYNSTIVGEINSVDELIGKNELFRDFKAVKDGRVYCTEPALFQKTTGMGDFIMDLNSVFTGEEREMIYLTKLE